MIARSGRQEAIMYRYAMAALGAVTSTLRWRRPTIFCYHSVTTGLDFRSSISADVSYLSRLISHARRHGVEILRLEEALDALRRGINAPFIVLTFDDGYLDNFTRLMPLLQAENTPATIFVTTGLVDRQIPMWWDALERLDACARPRAVSPKLGRRPITTRHELADRTSEFKLSEPAYQIELLTKLMRQAPDANLDPFGNALTWENLGEMSSSGLITIGSHTVTHPMLAALPRQTIVYELENSKKQLEARLNVSVNVLAYPFGQRGEIGPEAADIARDIGYVAAVTTEARPLASSDRLTMYNLPRVLLARKAQHPFINEAYQSGLPQAIKSRITTS